MSKVALGVSSSIGIYKACEVLRGFQKSGCEVQVIMTRNAAKLITPTLFSSLSNNDTLIDLFDDAVTRTIGHVALAKEVSLLCVAPATANVIAKFAAGVADDFLSTFFLAACCPVLVAPAMNEAMFLHPQTQANIRKLRAVGVELVEPEKGYLACQDEGWGRLADPAKIVQSGLGLIGRAQGLKNKTVVVTAGPTREFLDPVRFLSNPSSGKMGYELAGEARRRGAEVTLVTGPTRLVPPAGVNVERVVTAEEMKKAVLGLFPHADIVVMAAAVSDFRFKDVRAQKVKKGTLPSALAIEPTTDILALLGQKKKGQFLVGFAAETEDTVGHARAKMAEKNADLMVANTVGAGKGFESDEIEVQIISATGDAAAIPIASKREVSRMIFDAIEGAVEKKRR